MTNAEPSRSEGPGEPAGPPGSTGFPLLDGPINVRSLALMGVLLLLVLHTLVAARTLLLPVVLALLANLALSPLIRTLERARIAPPLGAALILAVVMGAAFGAFQLLAAPALEWSDRAPLALRELETKLRVVKAPLEKMGEATESVEQVARGERDAVREVTVRPASLAQTLFTQATYAVSSAAAMLVLLYFLLAGSDGFLRKIVELLPTFSDKKRAVQLMRQTEGEISRYLLTITLINALLGCSVAAVTWLYGLPNPLLWGALSALLNFVPYLGAIITAAVIGAVSLLTFNDPWFALAVPATCWAVSAFEGSFVTPSVLGRQLVLSPVAILLGLLVWGWLWGVAGVLIAVPVLMVTKIACDRSERLRWLGVLLSA